MNPDSRMIWLSMPALTKTIATSRKEAHIRAILATCNAPTLRVTVPSAVGNEWNRPVVERSESTFRERLPHPLTTMVLETKVDCSPAMTLAGFIL